MQKWGVYKMSIATPAISKAGVKLGGLTKGITGAINSVVSPVQELFGVKSEIYTIGYIPADWQESNPLLQNGLIGGLVRTVQNANRMSDGALGDWAKPKQYGTTIDGFFDFESTFEVDLPENPMMYDTPITDHRVRKPDQCVMNVFVSSYKSDDVLEEASKLITNNDLVSMVTGTSGDTARIRRKLNELRWLQTRGRPFRLYTPHGILENMVISKITPKNDEQTMDGFAARVEFREIVYYKDVYDTSSRVSKKDLSSTSKSFFNSMKSIFV